MALTSLTPISSCGQNCFDCMGVIILIFAFCSFTSVFWLVGFTDCGNFSDQYEYIILDEGLCVDTKNDVNDDYASCTSWSDIADNTSGSASDDANNYVSAHKFGNAAAAFSIFLLICMVWHRIAQDVDLKLKLRYGAMLWSAITALCFICMIGLTNNTYYTDADNYPAYSICSSYFSIPSAGYALTIIAFVMCLSLITALYKPCCGCMEKDEMATPINGSVQQQTQFQAQSGQQPQVVYVVQQPSGQPQGSQPAGAMNQA